MKYLLFLFVLTAPFFLKAQTEMSLLTAPFSIITTTNLYLPIGVEIQPLDKWSLYLEIALPLKIGNNKEIKNEKTYSVKAQLRRYSQKPTKYNLKPYLAFEIYYQPSFYVRENGTYFTKQKEWIPFVQTNVGTTNNNLSLKVGSKFISKKRFVFDFNMGFSLVQRSVKYYDVSLATVPIYSSGYENEIRDKVEEDYFSLRIGGSIRVGYLYK